MDYLRDGFFKGIGYWIYDFQALIVGIFALATVWYLRAQIKQLEEFNQKQAELAHISQINMYVFKMHAVCDSLGRKHRHFCDLKRKHPDLTPPEYWKYFRPPIPDSISLDLLSSSDFHVLHSKNKGELYNTCGGIFRANAITDQIIIHYSNLFDEFKSIKKNYTTYLDDKNNIISEFIIDPKTDPQLHAITLEISDVIIKLENYFSEAYQEAIVVVDEVNLFLTSENLPDLQLRLSKCL